jgi:hypothetical protein
LQNSFKLVELLVLLWLLLTTAADGAKAAAELNDARERKKQHDVFMVMMMFNDKLN